MIILAIDTAGPLCAACVYDPTSGAEDGRAVLDIGKGHAEHVMNVMDEAIKAAGKTFGDLRAIVVCVGPGSFTGVRVGVSAARGLALALHIPAIGVTALEALAEEARNEVPGQPVLAVTGNRRASLNMALFDADGAPLDGPRLATVEELAEAARTHHPVLTGNAAEMVAEAAGSDFQLGPLTATADIRTYARIAAERPVSDEKPKPLYLRAPDAKPQSSFALPLKER